ncbi:hypothetical protein GOP47_0001066 [Adiantum capillus-veneris]|uniref:Uncharacterized protein n=1 Tax=Adiantum capillus-veneris TaxID=13818 RepID=A0A9D4VGC2_ADICA|nr:hypothetical protein GOP47_0001066 [Adiantum capillus-veneris]
MRQCRSLEVLDLSYNSLSGAIPDWSIGSSFPSLKMLVLSNNRFRGFVPPSRVQNFTMLQVLMMANNSLSGPIPRNLDELHGMANTSKLTVNGNCRFWLCELQHGVNYPSKGLEALAAGSLHRVYISLLRLVGNKLQGPKPPQTVSLKRLHYVNLLHNIDGLHSRLSGTGLKKPGVVGSF